jgi:beta-lactam-binding protein with PASTA domain
MALLNKLVKFGIYAAVFLGALLCSLYLTSKWIIQSEEEVLVPNLVGHDTVYALDLLTSLGLNIKVGGFMWSETVPKNFIGSQEPVSGTWLKRDRDVKVVISRGSRRVRVPNLVGIRMREAKLVLSQNGLHLGGICRIPSSQYPRDTIVSQLPEALQEIERGESVDFLISDGPKSFAVAMPELRQRTIGQALKILDGLGLVAPKVQAIQQPGQPLNTIVGQSPLAGYRADGDSTIILTVNRVPQPTGPQAKLWWLTYRMEPGYFKKEVALSRDQAGEAVLSYSKIHRPGDRLDWLVLAQTPEQVVVRVDGVVQRLKADGFDWGNMLTFHDISSNDEPREE